MIVAITVHRTGIYAHNLPTEVEIVIFRVGSIHDSLCRYEKQYVQGKIMLE
jgi:hypothetical protein